MGAVKLIEPLCPFFDCLVLVDGNRCFNGWNVQNFIFERIEQSQNILFDLEVLQCFRKLVYQRIQLFQLVISIVGINRDLLEIA